MEERVQKWGAFDVAQKIVIKGNPFDVAFGAEFKQAGTTLRIPGFYDGNDDFKVRFMPQSEGRWEYQTYSDVPGFVDLTGVFDCVAPQQGNHGPVRVANQFHFAYADGTPHIPVGTTCYVWNLQGDMLEEKTLRTLDKAPFNKMRMCVFPKRYTFNSNEPPSYPFPAKFEGSLSSTWSPKMVAEYSIQQPPDYWDFERFNPEYFQHLEKRIMDLQERGIEADLIIFHPYDYGAWGFDRMPAEVNDRYLRYLVARLASFRNIWWSFANEYDLFVGHTM